MKIRWSHISFIIVLFVLGAIHQQQVSVPNQEIVLQFNDAAVSQDEAQQTILKVQEQLRALGADSITVVKDDNGNLKISYYSAVDVTDIESALSNSNLITESSSGKSTNDTEAPFSSSEHQVNFSLDVYEIQQSTQLNGFKGKLVLESQPDNDRFLSPNIYLVANTIDLQVKTFEDSVALKSQRNVVLAKENKSYQIPEVRAGPIA